MLAASDDESRRKQAHNTSHHRRRRAVAELVSRARELKFKIYIYQSIFFCHFSSMFIALVVVK